jgi:O-antigen/teichoic acid export membrane protein
VNVLKVLHLVGLLLFFLVWQATGGPQNLSLGQICIVLLVCISVTLDATWYGLYEHKLARLNIAGGIIRVVALFAIIYFVRSPDDVSIYALFILLPNIVVSSVTGVYAYRRVGFAKVKIAEIFETFKVSAPFGVVVFLYVFFDRFDLFLVGEWFGPEQLGAYAGASRVVQSLILLTGSIVLAFFAENIHIKEAKALQSHLSLNLWLLMTLAVPVMLGAPFVASYVMNFIFPSAPVATHSLFWVLALGFVGNVLITVFGLQLLLMQGKVKSMIFALVAGLAAALIFAVFFKNSLGSHSAAWGVVLGKWIAAIIIAYNGTKLIIGVPWSSIGRPLAAGVFMVLALLVFKPDGFFVTVLVGGVVYSAAVFFLNQEQIRSLLRTKK